MSDINKVVLIGRLVRDPGLKSTSGGAYFCRFSLASTKTYYRDTEKVEKTGFYDCVAWGKLGEIIAKHVDKGRRIAVDGQLDQQSWENSEGRKQSKTEIRVDNFQFLDVKNDLQNQADNNNEQTEFESKEIGFSNQQDMQDTDDIPF